ncbi:hypothetical protein [Nonomuraea turcica]|uniref:hypothetical protein n=1 Tax=Nonomuraea sp. G32 TaxID=3067274 RepID=UPI00273AA827|nr:hypothetical protein [Nonomuraea sp. G32]MDP4503705.1 hypothetical protein [Nonomuraea sp. G32]
MKKALPDHPEGPLNWSRLGDSNPRPLHYELVAWRSLEVGVAVTLGIEISKGHRWPMQLLHSGAARASLRQAALCRDCRAAGDPGRQFLRSYCLAGIAGFVLTLVDRRRQSRTSTVPSSAVEPETEAGEGLSTRTPQRRRSAARRLLLSPLVFLAAFLSSGMLVAAFDDLNDEIDLSAIVGWSVAVCSTLARVYFALRLRRASR